MIAKLPFNNGVTQSIAGRGLYGSTSSALRDATDISIGWITIYSTRVKNSIKLEAKHFHGTGRFFEGTFPPSDTKRIIKICNDAIKAHKLPETFYVKLSKK